MPTTRAKVIDTDQNLLMIIGQLVEAARVGSEGLKSLSAETGKHDAALATIVHTLETIQKTIEIFRSVIYNPTSGNLQIQTAVAGLTVDIAALRLSLETVKQQLGIVTSDKDRAMVAGQTMKFIAQVVAWAVTTAVAAYAAYGQWVKP